MWGAYLNEDLCIFTEPINGLYRIEFFSNIPHPEETDAIDCGTNEDLFLALAALREDNDYMQWFIDKADPYKTWYICGLHQKNECRQNVKSCRKATVEEIIEHFKD